MIMNPILFPLWVGGLIWLFFGKHIRLRTHATESSHDTGRYRLFGWTYLMVLIAFIALKAKNYYVAPIYPVLFAAGAIGLERLGCGVGALASGCEVRMSRW